MESVRAGYFEFGPFSSSGYYMGVKDDFFEGHGDAYWDWEDTSSYDGITKIDMDLNEASFHMIQGDSDRILVEITGEDGKHSKVVQKGDELKISNHYKMPYESTVTLYCPENLELEQLDIFLGAGEVSIDMPLKVGNLSGDKMGFECGIGSIEAYLDGSESDYSYELECAVGEMQIGNMSYGGIGEREIRNRTGNGKKIEASCAMGSVMILFQE